MFGNRNNLVEASVGVAVTIAALAVARSSGSSDSTPSILLNVLSRFLIIVGIGLVGHSGCLKREPEAVARPRR